MPTPVPGMDPFLERDDVWNDFLERFLPAAAEVIGAQALPDFIVKIDEHVYIHELPGEPRRLPAPLWAVLEPRPRCGSRNWMWNGSPFWKFATDARASWCASSNS